MRCSNMPRPFVLEVWPNYIEVLKEHPDAFKKVAKPTGKAKVAAKTGRPYTPGRGMVVVSYCFILFLCCLRGLLIGFLWFFIRVES